MAIPQEILDEYEQAAIPYIESQGAIAAEHCRLKSWRYFLEINSACNLRCPSCTKGNMAGYDHETGHMATDLMERILDKIRNENQNAIVFLYGNSEPFLHPKLTECIQAVKARGLHAEMSTNLNYINRVPEVLAAKPDFIIISLSGFTQDVYVRGHAGGNIEKVKANMRTVAELNNQIPLPQRVKISVNYHIYKYNEHEVPLMKEYATNLGIGFFTSYARAISMENAIQYLRDKEERETGVAVPFAVQAGKPDWNVALPPISESYKKTMEQLRIPPDKAIGMYEKYPICKVCPVGDMFTFIRHDGKTSLCACVADRRITLGDFLETSQEELSASRRGHAICKQCLRYRMNLYFHIVDREKWGG
jgi:MoaA/NifB/PqqE/SkfB family radical SAM enzyme